MNPHSGTGLDVLDLLFDNRIRNMKRNALIITWVLGLLLCTQRISAQYYFYDNYAYDTPLMFEIGVSGGVMNCLTDLGGKKGIGKPFLKDLNIGKTQLNAGVYVSALYKNAIGFRLEGTFGRVTAYDSILRDVRATTGGRYERNLNFRSKITEVSLITELHPLFMFINWASRDDEPPRFSPYVAAGIGVFSFNPQGKLGNRWVDLQPLSLEGQGFAEYPNRQPYKLTQFNVPIGLGIKYELSPTFNLRAEVMHRVLFTDYLDDVSTRYINPAVFANYFSGTQLQHALALASNDRVNPGGPTGTFRKTEGGIRGNPRDRDAYFTGNIKIGMTIGRERIR